jgi:hypothetical protein
MPLTLNLCPSIILFPFINEASEEESGWTLRIVGEDDDYLRLCLHWNNKELATHSLRVHKQALISSLGRL